MTATAEPIPALAVVTGATRRGTALVLEAIGPDPRVLLRCDRCGTPASAGVDEAAARLNLEANGGELVEGADVCQVCR